MATVLPQGQGLKGLIPLLQLIGQGLGDRKRKSTLLSSLTPDQQAAGQGLPLEQLQGLVGNLAQNEFMTPVQKAQQQNAQTLTNLKIQALQRPPALSDFENTIKLFNPEDKTKSRRIRALIDSPVKGKTPDKTGRISFDREFGVDADGDLSVDSITEFVPETLQAVAQDLGNRRAATDPKDIFATHLTRLGDDGNFTEGEKIDRSAITEVMPDIAQGAIIKGQNPINALENMMREWGNASVSDTGAGFFELAGTVPLSSVSDIPTRDEQGVLILEAVSPHLDPETQAEVQQVLESGDPDLIRSALDEIRNSFGGRKRRP